MNVIVNAYRLYWYAEDLFVQLMTQTESQCSHHSAQF